MKALILCGALTALAAPAVAGDTSIVGQPRPVEGLHDVYQTTVSLAHLDLRREAGADAALERIKAAARMVCGRRPGPWELAEMKYYRTCLSLAVDNAVVELDAPLVTARHTPSDPAKLAQR